MRQSIATDADRATALRDDVERQVDKTLDWVRPQLVELVLAFRAWGVTPRAFLAFEQALFQLLLRLGRQLLEIVVNGLEGDGSLPPDDIIYGGLGYRRLRTKSRNAHVATMFGTICLWRFGYRFWEPWAKESCVFPLELELGLLAGVTPALADHLGRKLAEAGSTQHRVLQDLKQEHHVSMGVNRLRKLLALLHENIAEHRQAAQVQALLDALTIASESRGNRKPVLAAGRDGITIRDYKYRFWEVATTATVTVFDRAGKRLTTIYLAWPPESGQAAMSNMMTELLTAVLTQWKGPLPALAYIADSGGNESNYFEETLRRMNHPRTGERMPWERVLDFYHASERIWAMSAALFGQGSAQYHAWAKRMLRILKTEPRGAKRVLHSAAAFAARIGLAKTRDKDFRKAYRYLRRRTKWMRYSEYKKRHIPLGSGITEAACKTVYTQRLKLSGMRWTNEGAQHILTLRTVLLSGTWQATYGMSLATRENALPRPYVHESSNHAQIAA
jgi:hypothetical protein